MTSPDDQTKQAGSTNPLLQTKMKWLLLILVILVLVGSFVFLLKSNKKLMKGGKWQGGGGCGCSGGLPPT